MLLVDQFPRHGRRRHVPPTCRSLMSFRATPPIGHQWLAALARSVGVDGLSQRGRALRAVVETVEEKDRTRVMCRRLVECRTVSSARMQIAT
jgi:hypothetical protein